MNMYLLTLLAACNRDGGPLLPTSAPGEGPEPVTLPATEPVETGRSLKFAEHGDRVAAADLDGDGVDEMLFVRDGLIFSGTEQVAAVGGLLQSAARGDIDGDGNEEAVLGFGEGRGFRDALAEVWAIHDDRVERLWSRDGERNQITDLHVVDGKVFVVAFASAKGAEGGWLEGGEFTPIHSVQMGAAQHPLPGGEVLVGRLYGDEPRSDGDLTVRKDGHTIETLPVLRGVKSLLAVQLDDDPELEVLVGDGWHYQYGLRAQGHLQLLDGIDLDRSRSIALLPESYAINRIELVRGSSPSSNSLLLTGASTVHHLKRDHLGWSDTRLETVSETGNAVVVYLEDGPWALISGSPATLVPLD